MAARRVCLSLRVLAKHVVIHHDGRMEPRTKEAARLIDKLLLNSENGRTFRRRWISIIRLAKDHLPELYQELMGYPADLPDLSGLRPPAGNSRPQGIAESHAVRRERGELPDVY